MNLYYFMSILLLYRHMGVRHEQIVDGIFQQFVRSKALTGYFITDHKIGEALNMS